MLEFKHEKVVVEGKPFDFFFIGLPQAPLLLVCGTKGFIMCGYLDISAAEKKNVCAAQVKGVGSLQDILRAQITAVTTCAQALGINVAMKAQDALVLLA